MLIGVQGLAVWVFRVWALGCRVLGLEPMGWNDRHVGSVVCCNYAGRIPESSMSDASRTQGFST